MAILAMLPSQGLVPDDLRDLRLRGVEARATSRARRRRRRAGRRELLIHVGGQVQEETTLMVLESETLEKPRVHKIFNI